MSPYCPWGRRLRDWPEVQTAGREAAPGREGWTQMEVGPLMHTPDPTNVVAGFASCGFVCVHGGACVLSPD